MAKDPRLDDRKARSFNCFKCCGGADNATNDHVLEPLNLMPADRLHASVEHLVEQSRRARHVAYTSIGRVQDFCIEEDPLDLSQSCSKWPYVVQRFQVIHRPRENTVVLVSDGLSDPFDDLAEDANVNGYGIEFFIETPISELGLSVHEIKSSWQYQLLFTVCSMAAGHGGIRHMIDYMDILSTEAEGVADAIPSEYRNQHVNLEDRVGALLGLLDESHDNRYPNIIDSMPLSEVRLVNIKLIKLSELQLITESGAEGRKKLSQLFSNDQDRLISSLTRQPVV